MNQKKAGVLLSYGQTALSTLISLTYTPVMLRLLGQSEYGLYTLVNGFVSNLSLLSFGMGSAYMRYYSRAEVQDGEEGVAALEVNVSCPNVKEGGVLFGQDPKLDAAVTAAVGVRRSRSVSVVNDLAGGYQFLNTCLFQHILKLVSRSKYDFHSSNGIGIYIFFFILTFTVHARTETSEVT